MGARIIFPKEKPDWKENNQNAGPYIKNRPFYDYFITNGFDSSVTFSASGGYAISSIYGIGTYPTDFVNLFRGEGAELGVVVNGVERRSAITNLISSTYYAGNPHIVNSNLDDNGLDWCVWVGSLGQSSVEVYLPSSYAGSQNLTLNIYEAAVEEMPERFVPDKVKRNTYEVVQVTNNATFDAAKFFDIDGETLTLSLPVLESNECEVYRGTLHGNFSVTFPTGTYIKGDLNYITVSGTTISGTSSEWYLYEYNSYVKSLIVKLYHDM